MSRHGYNNSTAGILLRLVWRHQRGNQNPHIKEEQTTQWPKEKSTKGQMSRYGGLTSYRGYHQLKILFIAKQIIVFVLFTNFTLVYTPGF
jgi:hypothetical protein